MRMTDMSGVAQDRNFGSPWIAGDVEERRFRMITAVVLIVAAAFGAVPPLVPVPETPRTPVSEPPRVARLLMRTEPPPPPSPPPRQVAEPPPPPPRQAAEPRPERRPPPPPPPQSAARTEQLSRESARAEAARSGLLALRDQLDGLRNSGVAARVARQRVVSHAGQTPPSSAPPARLEAGITADSGGIDDSGLSRETGDIALAGREITRVEDPEEAAAGMPVVPQPPVPRSGVGKTPRTAEEIQRVFERNKGRLDVIYKRALRRDPALAGKVVLRLTVAPSGRVTACEIVSSELKAPALERKLVTRVRLFDFGHRADAAETTFTYPIDFFPG